MARTDTAAAAKAIVAVRKVALPSARIAIAPVVDPATKSGQESRTECPSYVGDFA